MELPETGKFHITPGIGPGYTPELGWLLAAAGLVSVRLVRDTAVQASNLSFSAYGSTTGAFGASVDLATYAFNDKLRVLLNGSLGYQPDHYFGVGYDAGRNTPRGDSTTAFDRRSFKFQPTVYVRVRPGLYLGTQMVMSATDVLEASPGVQADPEVQWFGSSVRLTGLGGTITYDTRDMAANSYRGLVVTGSVMQYLRFLGGDQQFTLLTLDYRQARTIRRPGRRLVWSLNARYVVGDVPLLPGAQGPGPYTDLPRVESPLRGYSWGQYRDRFVSYGIAEYRHQFVRKTPRRNGSLESKWAVVGWGGMALIGPDPGATLHGLPNAGVGVRYELQPRLNARVDFGWGRGTSGFYVSFKEAF